MRCREGLLYEAEQVGTALGQVQVNLPEDASKDERDSRPRLPNPVGAVEVSRMNSQDLDAKRMAHLKHSNPQKWRDLQRPKGEATVILPPHQFTDQVDEEEVRF